MPRWSVIGALIAALASSDPAAAQGLAIDHKDVACIVAGEYARLSACFAPASQVARARVYFRPEAVTTWYYVEMTSDAPCHAGILPRPSRKLIDTRVHYYVEALDRGSAPGQTAEFSPIVVESAEECRTRGIVAPLSEAGPAAVFPSVPLGFGGPGVSTGVIVGGVAAASIVAGGAVALGGDDDPPAPVTPTPPPPTSPPATTPPVTQPPVTTPPGDRDSLVVACTATPRNGDAPLRVEFATFPTGGTGTYQFSWDFRDGGSSANPNPSHTFLAPGVYDATVTVTSGSLSASCARAITVTTPPSTPPTTTPAPTSFKLRVALAGTGAGVVTGPGITCLPDCEEFYPPGAVVTLTATANAGSVFKQWGGDCSGTAPTCTVTMSIDRNVTALFETQRTLTVQAGGNSDVPGSVTSTPAGINCSWTPPVPCTSTAIYIHGSVVTLTVTTGGLRIIWGGACTGATGNVCTVLMDANKVVDVNTLRTFQAQVGDRTPLLWSSQLDVPDAEGRITVNGGAASVMRAGRTAIHTERRAGASLVEAVLSRAGGRAGAWRFEFPAGVRAGSLRVQAGTATLVTADTIVFTLRGAADERVAFTFETDE